MSNNETPGGQRIGWVLALIYIPGLYATVYWHAIWSLPGFDPFGRAVIAILVGDPDASQALAAFLVGLAGFLGVGATLWWNAKQQRVQHQREIDYERERRIELDRREAMPAAALIAMFASEAQVIRNRLLQQEADFVRWVGEWNKLLERCLPNYETEIFPRFSVMPSWLAYDLATEYTTLQTRGRIGAGNSADEGLDAQDLAIIYSLVATRTVSLDCLARRVLQFVEGIARTDDPEDELARLKAQVDEEERQLRERLDR